MNDTLNNENSTDAFEKALQETSSDSMYVMRLYVSGMTLKSMRAIENIKEICTKHLQGRYELEVVDIYNQPQAARQEQIIAAPTLIKKLPLPLRKFIGDLSDTEKILVGLSIIPKNPKSEA